MISRVVAAAGVLAVIAALAILAGVRLSVPRDAYVSELGADGEPTAGAFRVALLLVVAGGAAVAVAGRGIRSRPAVLRWWPPSVTLAASSALFLVAAQVPCSPGCPVPYGPLFTWQDFTHTTAATLAFVAACWAMLQCAFAVGHRVLRGISLGSAIAVAVTSATGGLMSLFGFYANEGSRLEWVATGIGLAWMAVFGTVVAFGPREPAAPRDSATPGGAATRGGSATQGDEELVGEEA